MNWRSRHLFSLLGGIFVVLILIFGFGLAFLIYVGGLVGYVVGRFIDGDWNVASIWQQIRTFFTDGSYDEKRRKVTSAVSEDFQTGRAMIISDSQRLYTAVQNRGRQQQE